MKINAKQKTHLNLTINVNYNFQALFSTLFSIPLAGWISKKVSLYSRPCLVGEILIKEDNICYYCPERQYSIVDPMDERLQNQKCQTCPDNSNCAGGIFILPNKGHWRAVYNSSKVISCFADDSCVGVSNITTLDGN